MLYKLAAIILHSLLTPSIATSAVEQDSANPRYKGPDRLHLPPLRGPRRLRVLGFGRSQHQVSFFFGGVLMIQIVQKGFSLFPESLICLRVLGVGDVRNSV